MEEEEEEERRSNKKLFQKFIFRSVTDSSAVLVHSHKCWDIVNQHS